MANRLSELMAMPDKGARFAENVLTKSFRDTLRDVDTTEEGLHMLALAYLRNKGKQEASDNILDETKLANDKGNLKKEMEKNVYSYKVWLKLWRILRPKWMTLTVNAGWHDGHLLNGGKGFTYYPLDFGADGGDATPDDDEIDEEFIKTFMETLKEAEDEVEVVAPSVELDLKDVG